MTAPQPRNPDFADRVRDSFGRQAFMRTIGAELTEVAPGRVEMRLPYRPELGQQHGFFHGGVIGTLADNAGGYAAFTLMAPEDSILTVEYKMNIVSPGRGEALVAVGTVLKPGRTLTICDVKVYAETAGERKLCATALCTLMTMKDMSDDKAV
ncbi:MAG: PaaI family thioesterase [Alphaproteobacteria bacterium]|nr:PaaI family thioesterase [Alphaproteobacteria bacterium]